jgi:hypothetical protein
MTDREDTESPQWKIRLEVKKTRHGKVLTFADSAAPSGLRGMTDAEMKAHDYIEKLTSRFETDRVSPGVVGCVQLDGDDIVGVNWCSDEARAAAGGED